MSGGRSYNPKKVGFLENGLQEPTCRILESLQSHKLISEIKVTGISSER